MNNTHYYFIPYLREGLTAAIKQSENVGQRPEIDVILKAKAREMETGNFKPVPIRQKIQLYGSGDVLGFHNRIVVRTDPVHNTGNFEPNYFPAIEFAEPDFAWRFTAEPTNDIHGSLTPWITLIVLIAEKGQEEFTDETSNNQSKVPCIEVHPKNLPNLEHAWQWAHVQVTSEQGEISEGALKEIINDHPEQAICRLMSPRRLRPQTLYNAFVVPTFKLGMAAAGIPGVVRDGLNANDKSWTNDSTEEIILPYYYKWEFRTSIRGDFEYLLRLLKPRDLPGLGTRDMNCEKPGYGIAGVNRSGIETPNNYILKLEGALQAFETEYTPWGNDKKEPTPEMFQEEVAQKLLNKPARDLGHATTDQQSGRFTYLVAETSAITDIALSIREDGKSVRFIWKTPQESGSRIDYGLTSEYGNYEARNVLRTDHTLTLTGLVPQKHYFFKISALNNREIVEGSFDLPELPSVVPPIYGRWHRGKQTVDPLHPDKWINTLNLDPRHRAAAGLGAQVIKKQQEARMASAWEQLSDLLRANRTLSRAQVGRDCGINLHRRISELHLDQFLFYTAPVQKRVTMENPCTQDDNEQPWKISVDQFIKRNTQIPL
ncbi:MAG: fibronectin type III domain-containing protein, partial [Bacteroidales bacterium]|nr:fibronectin type III domain-containing protein [Bacteroidales bacterium]